MVLIIIITFFFYCGRATADTTTKKKKKMAAKTKGLISITEHKGHGTTAVSQRVRYNLYRYHEYINIYKRPRGVDSHGSLAPHRVSRMSRIWHGAAAHVTTPLHMCSF